MSKIFLSVILVFCISIFGVHGQGTINGFSYIPAQPTPSDSITFFVEVSFPSGGCDPDSKGFNINGFNVTASALHCVGMLTVICDYVDTFKIGPQPIGSYTFDMTLSSGFAPAPCTPGIVPDDTKSFSFTVAALTSVKRAQTSKNILVYPNPANNYIVFDFIETPVQLSLYNSYGQLVFNADIHDKQFRLNTKPYGKGVFFYSYNSKQSVNSGKLILE